MIRTLSLLTNRHGVQVAAVGVVHRMVAGSPLRRVVLGWKNGVWPAIAICCIYVTGVLVNRVSWLNGTGL